MDLATAIALEILSAISVPALISIAVFLGGTWIKAEIDGRVRHSYDLQLEELRAALSRQADERRAENQARDGQLHALRDTALSAMSSRHAALDQRRLIAAERLWAAVAAQAPAKAALRMVAPLNMDEVFRRVAAGGEDA